MVLRGVQDCAHGEDKDKVGWAGFVQTRLGTPRSQASERQLKGQQANLILGRGRGEIYLRPKHANI